MTLSKLSLRNARRQAGDYLVYFVTIIMACALVYAFNGLVFSDEIRDLSAALDSLPIIIVLTSAVVVCIIGWLVHYTIGFMLSRRSRELGTYILIGLESNQVARLFFLENLAVGGIALLLGTLLGNLVFQILRAISLSLFQVPYTFSAAFSLKAVGLTVLYFTVIYLLALFRGRKRIQNMKICDLIYYDRKNEGEVIKKERSRRRIFILSIVSGILGTVLLLMRHLIMGIIGSGFVILFLYGFFLSFSSGVPAYFNRHVQRKYKGQTLLIFRSLSAKLGTMGVVMATIALLFTATLISEGTGLVFSSQFQSNARQTTNFDLYIGSSSKEEARFDPYLSYVEENIPVESSRQYSVYQGESRKVMDYVKENAEYWGLYEYDALMKERDYAALRKMSGYPEVSLKSGQYLIHCMEYLEDVMKDYTAPLTIGGETLTAGGVYSEVFTQLLWDGNGKGYILVVPDEAVLTRPVSHRNYAAMTSAPLRTEDVASLNDIREEMDHMESFDTIFSKTAVETDNATLYAMVVFPLFYLALILTMVSATILTIQQLSESGRYRRQFELLDRLGMDPVEMRKTLRRQFAIYYSMPAIPPLLISIPFLFALGGALDPGVLNGTIQIVTIVGTTLFFFFLIYMIYILMAYTSLKRNVLPVS